MAHDEKAECNIVEYNGVPVFLLAVYSMACYNYFHVFLSFLLPLLSFFMCVRDLGFGEGKGRRGGGVVGRLWLCSPDPPIKLCSIPIISYIGSNFLGTLSTLCKRRPTFLLLFPLKTMRSLQKPLSPPPPP